MVISWGKKDGFVVSSSKQFLAKDLLRFVFAKWRAKNLVNDFCGVLDCRGHRPRRADGPPFTRRLGQSRCSRSATASGLWASTIAGVQLVQHPMFTGV